ncbi:unnamed protein product [Durusdinium trenchii]|uniref:Uncharacterized protein n=1 Tax=Durusdinium trenchii TaxID=1381693 RepID=A0ABP0P0I6_9DINO
MASTNLSILSVQTDLEDSQAPSCQRLEIHSSFEGSQKVRRERFVAYHRTTSPSDASLGPDASIEELQGRDTSELHGLRVRDIPWLDEDEDDGPHEVADFLKVQKLQRPFDAQGSRAAAERPPHPPVPPVRLVSEDVNCANGAYPMSARGAPPKRVSPIAQVDRSVQSARQDRTEIGRPVTFYLEGRPEQYFGRVRGVENGRYSVDVVGGGRKAGLDAVTPCSEEDLQKAQLAKSKAFQMAKLIPRPSLPRTVSNPELDRCPELEVGTPVAFFAQNRTLYGRIRSNEGGVYSVDLPGGGIKVVKSKKPLLYHVDAWSGYKTRNAVQPPSEDQRWPLVRRKSSTPRATSQVRPVPTLRGVAIAKV